LDTPFTSIVYILKCPSNWGKIRPGYIIIDVLMDGNLYMIITATLLTLN